MSAVGSSELDEMRFDALLAALDGDREKAGEKYERIRGKLLRLFDWRGASDPERLADETIDRVARKLGDGLSIEASDPYRYFSAVAGFVYREMLKERRVESVDPEVLDRQPVVNHGGYGADEERLACLDACLDALPPETRALVIDYHQGEKGARIENRARLAARLGVTAGALRIRLHRIRDSLEQCLSRCTQGSA